MVNYDLCHLNENMILSKISLLLILNGKNSMFAVILRFRNYLQLRFY